MFAYQEVTDKELQSTSREISHCKPLMMPLMSWIQTTTARFLMRLMPVALPTAQQVIICRTSETVYDILVLIVLYSDHFPSATLLPPKNHSSLLCQHKLNVSHKILSTQVLPTGAYLIQLTFKIYFASVKKHVSLHERFPRRLGVETIEKSTCYIYLQSMKCAHSLCLCLSYSLFKKREINEKNFNKELKRQQHSRTYKRFVWTNCRT